LTNSSKTSFKSQFIDFSQRYGILFVIILYAIIVGFLNPRFISLTNILNISRQMVPMGIIALGMTFVLISAGIDLSAGFAVGTTAVASGLIFDQTGSFLLAFIVALGIGAILGLLNGLIITKLGIQPFITTLATMAIVQGVTLVIATGEIIFVRHRMFTFLGSDRIFQIPISFIILIILYIIGYILLNRTKIGVYTFAMGDNEEAARLAGIKVDLYKTMIYVMCGLCVGITGLISLSRASMVNPNIGGIQILLDAIAALIIGGTSLTGGRGTIQGTFLGVIFMGMLANSLGILGVASEWHQAFRGGVIIFAVLFNYFATPQVKEA